MAAKRRPEYFNFATRSVALVRDRDFQAKFEVICYGLPWKELASVQDSAGENMSGGAQLRRRLEARGIDTEEFQVNIFDTAPLLEDYNHGT